MATTLPVFWGDCLVTRFDSKLDRPTNIYIVLSFWLEEEALGKDEHFTLALARGFARFVTFFGAAKLDVSMIDAPPLRQQINSS